MQPSVVSCGAEFSQFLGQSVLNPPRSPLAAGNFLYVLGGKLQAARHPTVEAPMALPAKQLTQARRAATVS
jgi:hypothetical protein